MLKEELKKKKNEGTKCCKNNLHLLMTFFSHFYIFVFFNVSLVNIDVV